MLLNMALVVYVNKVDRNDDVDTLINCFETTTNCSGKTNVPQKRNQELTLHVRGRLGKFCNTRVPSQALEVFIQTQTCSERNTESIWMNV